MEIDIKAAMLSGLEEAVAQAVREIWDNREDEPGHKLNEIVFRARALEELIQRQFPEHDAELVSLPMSTPSFSALLDAASAMVKRLAEFSPDEMYREMIRSHQGSWPRSEATSTNPTEILT